MCGPVPIIISYSNLIQCTNLSNAYKMLSALITGLCYWMNLVTTEIHIDFETVEEAEHYEGDYEALVTHTESAFTVEVLLYLQWNVCKSHVNS